MWSVRSGMQTSTDGSLPPRFNAMMKRLSERTEVTIAGSTAPRDAQKPRFFTGNLPVSDGDDWNAGYYMRKPLRADEQQREQDGNSSLGTLMLTSLLETPAEGLPDLDHLMQVLGYAMTARDVWATMKIWDKIASEVLQVGLISKDKWSIYVADAKWPDITNHLLEFLALKVRRPRLLIVVLEARMEYSNSGTLLQNPDGTRMSAPALRRVRMAAAAVIASILLELYYLPRHGLTYQDDRSQNRVLWRHDAKEREAEERGLRDGPPSDADEDETILGGWKCLILTLCRLVPHNPEWAGGLHVVWRIEEAVFGRTLVTPLDMAVLSSERFPVALDLLGAVAWERSELTTAFQLAMHPSAIRTPMMCEVAKALYARVVQPNNPAVSAARAYHRIPGNELVYCEVMWVAIYRAASFYAYTEVHGLNTSGIAVAMMQPNQGHPPEIYEDIMRCMFEATTGTPMYTNTSGDTFAHMLRRVLIAILVPSPNPMHALKPDLASLLMQFLDEMDILKAMILDSRLAVLRYPPQEERGNLLWLASWLPPHHFGCLLEHLEAQMQCTSEAEALELWDAGFGALIAMLATRGHAPRDNFDALFELLAKQPDRLRDALAGTSPAPKGPLDQYVRRFCAPVTRTHLGTPVNTLGSLSREARAAVATQIKEGLERFLNAGEWSQAHLRTALRTASILGSSTAVQVLISPPWNAPMTENDGFVRAIFDAVFAPGEPVVRSAGVAFADLQRAE